MKKVESKNKPLECPVCHHTLTIKPELTALAMILIYKKIVQKVIITSYKEQRKTYRAMIRSLGYRSIKEYEYEEESDKCTIGGW
jgi:hypothetical protein